MRSIAPIAALAIAFLPLPVIAASDIPTCSGIALVSPSQGAHFIGSRPIHFSWSGEPVGTESRDLHLAGINGSETVIPLDGRFSDTVKVRMTGDVAWVVVFKDADGNPICVSPAGLISSGPGGGKVGAGTASLSSPGSAAPGVSIFMRDGRLVIVLQNSPYTGQYTKLIASDHYDGSTENLKGAKGLEIHGNNIANTVTGSPGHDLVYLYGGDDTAEGGAGNDILVGGADNDDLRDISPPNVGDTDSLYGGPGSDTLQMNDLDTLDAAYGGPGEDIFVSNPGDIVVLDGPENP